VKSKKTVYYLFTSLFVSILLVQNVWCAEDIELSVQVSAPLNSPEFSLATALETACPDIPNSESDEEQTLFALCEFYLDETRGTPEQKSIIISELSAKNTTSNNTGISRPPISPGQNGINMRLAALRKGTRTLVNSYRFKAYRNNKKSNNAQDEGGLLSNKLSAYLNASMASGEHIETNTEMGFDDSSKAILLGFDYRLHTNTFVGLASNYTTSELALSDPGSDISASMAQFIVYGSHFLNQNTYLQFSFQGTRHNIDMSRSINFQLDTGPVNEIANATTSGNQIGFNLSGGYDRHIMMGYNAGITGALNYQSSSLDAYTEKNAKAYNLHVNEQNISSLTSDIKATVSATYSFPWGVFLPQISANWIHEFQQAGDQITANFSSDINGNKFSFDMQDVDPNYFTFSFNGQVLLPKGRSAFIGLTTIQRLRDREQWVAMIGYRQEF